MNAKGSCHLLIGLRESETNAGPYPEISCDNSTGAFGKFGKGPEYSAEPLPLPAASIVRTSTRISDPKSSIPNPKPAALPPPRAPRWCPPPPVPLPCMMQYRCKSDSDTHISHRSASFFCAGLHAESMDHGGLLAGTLESINDRNLSGSHI